MPTKYYFDNAATTPVREEVLQEILPYFREYYGNASSIYSIAKESKKALQQKLNIMRFCIPQNFWKQRVWM